MGLTAHFLSGALHAHRLVRVPVRFEAQLTSERAVATAGWLGSRLLAPTEQDGAPAPAVVVSHGEKEGHVVVIFDGSDGRTVEVARAACTLVPNFVPSFVPPDVGGAR